MTNKMFDSCVALLLALAALTGAIYREVSVIIFSVLWPSALAWLMLVILRQRDKIRDLEKKCVTGVLK